MGYNNESSLDKPVVFKAVTDGLNRVWHSERNVTFNGTHAKTQYGYRSGPLSEAEQEEVNLLDRTGTWGDTVAQISALERIQRATSSSGMPNQDRLVCHDRTYTVKEGSYSPVSGILTELSGAFRYRQSGAAQIQGVNGAFKKTPLSTSEVVGLSGKIMRRYRPTKPIFDLTRFIGELKDAPSLFSKSNYIPSGVTDFGGGFLNYQFGIAPTVSDIRKAAEAVVKSHDIISDFVKQSAEQVKRSFTEQLGSETKTGFALCSPAAGAPTIGDVQCKYDMGYSDYGRNTMSITTYLNWRRTLHVFSTFEYFVGDPNGATTRMDDYLSKAKKILGGGLTLPVAYQLTPFSWMLDWFYDVGGLLAYQQDVADNGIVQTMGGSTITDEYYASATWAGGINTSTSAFTGGGSCNYHERTLVRRPGSPYDMSPTWSMDPYRWSIVGALGLLKAKGLAPIFE